ncbi:unnamed protein product, partial [Allacma fusca]
GKYSIELPANICPGKVDDPPIRFLKADPSKMSVDCPKVHSQCPQTFSCPWIQLSEDSKRLTTFITDDGRFCFARLPFGISSAPEYYQKRVRQALEGLPGVVNHTDDTLVWGSTIQEHDERLRAVLGRLAEKGYTLNKDKCVFAVTEVEFLGHRITTEGVLPDKKKIKAIVEMPPPSDVSKVRSFVGMRGGVTEGNSTIVSSDSSSYGLGAVLRQLGDDGNLHPVAYASRTLSQAERGYAQIEKEALAMVETDHKPLLAIMKTKNLDELSPRLLRFRMRMMRYSYDIFHTPGQDLVAADTLSRNPLPETGDTNFEADVEAQCKDELSVTDGLLMRGIRLVIPPKLRPEMLQRIHTGHLGITKCRSRAKEYVRWPRISAEIQEIVEKCTICIKFRRQEHEPLIPSEFPTRAWEKVAIDLFYLEGKTYLLMTDYYSRYPEIAKLESQTSDCVISHCKSIFARHGIPEEVRSDNGPQFEPLKTVAFKNFAQDYGFRHITSSPFFPQRNGFVEAMVKVVKAGMKKNVDTYKLLLEYRATPLANGFSPSELMMSRKIRTTLPTARSNLLSRLVPSEMLNSREEKRRIKQKQHYDQHHRVHEKVDFEPGEVVWVADKRKWGTVTSKAETPRSFWIDTPRGKYRRNSFHLLRAFRKEIPEDEYQPLDPDLVSSTQETLPTDSNNNMVVSPVPKSPYITRIGRAVKKPTILSL